MVAHVTQEAEAWKFQTSLGNFMRPYLKIKKTRGLGMWLSGSLPLSSTPSTEKEEKLFFLTKTKILPLNFTSINYIHPSSFLCPYLHLLS